jgi:hypothetical protein
MALRAKLETDAAVPACDVPTLMCQILQQLVQDHNTANLFRYRNHSTMNPHSQYDERGMVHHAVKSVSMAT